MTSQIRSQGPLEGYYPKFHILREFSFILVSHERGVVKRWIVALRIIIIIISSSINDSKVDCLTLADFSVPLYPWVLSVRPVAATRNVTWSKET
jgi:hypothetical protein